MTISEKPAQELCNLMLQVRGSRLQFLAYNSWVYVSVPLLVKL